MATLAHPHNRASNRAKARSALDRKPVFKGVLENPFHISWPSLPLNLQSVALPHLVAILGDNPSRHHVSRKSLQKPEIVGQGDTMGTAEAECGHIRSSNSDADRSWPIIGINAVTRALESQLRQKCVVVPGQLMCDKERSHPVPASITVVFICREDVDPPVLVDHIPYLVAGCNSQRNLIQPVKLVPLPKHSESAISAILGIRRAAVLAFRNGSRSLGAIQYILDAIPMVSAPWILPDVPDPQLVPTHIKQLRTTAPKDMKSAKEQRSKARVEARKKNTIRGVHRKPRLKLTNGVQENAIQTVV